jgi:hypothetical protein
MKRILLISSLILTTQSAMSQNFSYPIGQHIVEVVSADNFASYQIDINTPSFEAIQYDWQLLSNTFPAAWSYSICDYTNCAVGIPSSGSMTPITLTEAQNGIIGWFKINLTVGQNFGQGKVEIYVYDSNDFSRGDTVSWDLIWPNISGLSQLDEATVAIYPNPIRNALSVDVDVPSAISHFRMIDAYGKEVYMSNEIMLSNTVDINNLQDGVYFIEVYDMNGAKKTEKVIKL